MVNYQATGDNATILAEYKRANATGQRTRDELVNDATNYGEKSKDQIKYINEQVQAQERLNKIKYQTYQTQIQETRNTQLGNIGDDIAAKGLVGSAATKFAKEREKEINTDYSETSRLAREQFNEAKTQTSQLRSVVDTIRTTGKEEILNAKGNASTIADRIKVLGASADPNDRAVASYMKAYSPELPVNKLSLFAQAVLGTMLDATQRGIVQMAGSKNAYDMVRPAMNTVGGVAGTTVTLVLSALGGYIGGDGGERAGSTLGKKLSKFAAKAGNALSATAPTIGGMVETGFNVVGEEEARNLEARQDVARNILKTRAITGVENMPVSDLSKMGLTYEEVALKQGQIAKSYGNAENLNSRTRDVVSISKGMGLSEETLTGLIGIQRNTDKSLAKTIGEIKGAGGKEYGFDKDRSFLGEFTDKFLSLQKNFMQSSTRVGDATTYDSMALFNKIGGQFATSDVRGMSNLESVQSSISNPGSDAMKAMSYNVLRQLHPDMGLADLELEMSKGMQSQGYLQAMMKAVASMGGGEDYQRRAISGMMNISPAAAKELYQKRDVIESGTIRDGGLDSYDDYNFAGDAERATNNMDAYFSDQKNAFVRGAMEGFEEIAKNFLLVVREAFGNSTIIVTKNGQLTFNAPAQKVDPPTSKLPKR